MTIHDELLWALTQPDKKGKIPLYETISSYEVNHQLEYSHIYFDRHRNLVVKMVPDILIFSNPPGTHHYVIEVENDIRWDFSDSLRQIKKYQEYLNLGGKSTKEYMVIIPSVYKRFTPMYENEKIGVWTWEARRLWQCMKCDTIIEGEGSVKTNCTQCKEGRGEANVRLHGLRDLVLQCMYGERPTVRRIDP